MCEFCVPDWSPVYLSTHGPQISEDGHMGIQRELAKLVLAHYKFSPKA